MSFRSSKETHYLKLIRYHGTSIENTCCYQHINSDPIHRNM